MNELTIKLENCRMTDVEHVGGKNASLGEMISQLNKLGVNVPGGFATTAFAYRHFIDSANLADRINNKLKELDVDNIKKLTEAGSYIRKLIMDTPFPDDLKEAITLALELIDPNETIDFAVRSSATAEDLPEASFAGQQETLLNVSGKDAILSAVHEVFASLFNDRAIAYRVHNNFDHSLIALSVGIQRMVRSDQGSSGVMFTLDTESGFRDVVFITSSYGLGEMVVQGAVNPDEFYIYKPLVGKVKTSIIRKNMGSKKTKMIYSDDISERVKIIDVKQSDQTRFSLTDEDIMALTKQAIIIENHYGRPMDIEWGKDGTDDGIYILQARPETVQSRNKNVTTRYTLNTQSNILITGRSIGQKIGSGIVKIVSDIGDMDLVKPGDVLVADMTDPDWEPVMKRASAIVTNRGGRTCHAAIIARELGIPAVVGCENATSVLTSGQLVTVSCAEGDEGKVYDGILDFDKIESELKKLPDIPIKIMMNVGNPDRAFSFAGIPNKGVGLARLEFIINRMIGVHPQALLGYDDLNLKTKKQVDSFISGYPDPVSFYIDKLAEGVGTIAAAFYPKPVIVRLSDFKSNEYANLVGGDIFEPHEENPMLGFRGASRYVDPIFRPCFEMECKALRKVRDDMGFTNVQVMVPFVRTLSEAEKVIDLLKGQGLESGKNDLKIIMMCELPCNAVLAKDFLNFFDGMSIGSNDMTQLTLGLDRDSAKIANSFDERDPAVKYMLKLAIDACNNAGKYIGICGQGPSDHIDLAEWLVKEGIQSISLNPDSVVSTWERIANLQK
jgi:pyruvate, water dikinase